MSQKKTKPQQVSIPLDSTDDDEWGDGCVVAPISDEQLKRRPPTKPDFLPSDWESHDWPPEPTMEACREWCFVQMEAHRQLDRLGRRRSGVQTESVTAGEVVRDVFRLVGNTNPIPGKPVEPQGPFTHHDAVRILQNVHDWMGSNSALELSRASATTGTASEGIDAAVAPAPSAVPPQGENVFRTVLGDWQVAFRGSEFVHFEHLLGMGYIHEAILRPNDGIDPIELVVNHSQRSSQETVPTPRDEHRPRRRHSSSFENKDAMVTGEAIRSARETLTELRADFEDAKTDNNELYMKELQPKIDKIEEYLAGCVNIKGQSRKFSGPRERARQSVQKAISRAIETIRKKNSALASYLQNHIETGDKVIYTPEPGVSFEL